MYSPSGVGGGSGNRHCFLHALLLHCSGNISGNKQRNNTNNSRNADNPDNAGNETTMQAMNHRPVTYALKESTTSMGLLGQERRRRNTPANMMILIKMLAREKSFFTCAR